MRPLVRLHLLLLAVAIAGVLCASAAQAVVPPLVQYQGFLTDLAGQPLDGTHDLTFALYDDSAVAPGTPPLWQESHAGVPVAAGAFAVLLGSTSPLGPTVFTGGTLWLETSVDGTPLLPRRPMTSVGYAFRAAQADVATGLASGGPIVVHTADTRPGCPVTTGPSGVLVSQNVSLTAPGSVMVSGHIARYGVGRVDLTLYVDGASVQNVATYTPVSDWMTGVVQWAGALATGSHTIEMRSSPGTSWGCGAGWGAIDTIVLK